MMWKVILIGLCGIFIGFAPVTSDDAMALQKFMTTMQMCAANNKVEDVHMEKLKRGELPDDMAAKCLLACAYKSGGMMDEKGMMSPEGVLAQVNILYAGDDEKMDKARKYVEICKIVNDEAVTDGEKGCDRAGKIYKCTVDNAAQFGMPA